MSRTNPTARLEPRVYDLVDACSRKYGVGLTGAITLLLLNDSIRREFIPQLEATIPERSARRRRPVAQ